MIENGKFKLGLFVITAVTLFIAAIFVFGLSDVFRKKVRVYSVFRESVQGLDIGAPVKYKGVRIGKVSRMDILGSCEMIVVHMDIDLSVFRADGEVGACGAIDSESFTSFINNQVKKGITCGLELAGITGMKYVEFDFAKNNGNYQEIPRISGIDGIYIPARPSMLQNILKMVNDSLANLSSVKVGEIASELSSIFKRTNEIINSPKVANTIDQIERAAVNVNRTMENVNNTVTKPRLDELFKLLADDLRNFNALIEQVRTEVAGARLKQTAADARQSFQAVVDTRNSIVNTLLRLEQTLDSVNEFINSIDDDPSSLLRGKNREAIVGSDNLIKSSYLDSPKESREKAQRLGPVAK